MRRLDEIIEGKTGSHILPFLWLKGETDDIISEELDRIEECGIREVCLESRPHPDFGGDGWWKELDFILSEAEKRGMRVWILDDKKFPTGYANGGFERSPELSKLYIAERHMDIMGPCRDSAVLVENFRLAPGLTEPDGKLLGIFACPKPDTETLNVCREGMIDLTENVKDGFVYFDLPEGAYRLFIIFTTHKGGGRDNYMNLIDRRSVRVLIDEVYEKHYEKYARYFGNTIAGFFSDEPELGNEKGYPFDAVIGKRDVKLPWSDELEERLKKQWGDGFAENLVSLWYGEWSGTAAVRSDYMENMTDLVYSCFSGQLGQWCSDHGVEYIGHVIEDDNAHARMGCGTGHYFKEMRGQHMAGVDVVHHQIVPGFTGKVHQWIAGDRDGEFFHFGLAKLGSSAAHMDPAKKNRALCEIFGNYGWAEGVPFMKWLTNHMLVRGINMFTPHAFTMTYPDRDCPPHFYARGNNPEFQPFACLMRYMQRAAGLLSEGKPLMSAAVLYHAEAEWTGEETQLYQKPVRALAEAQSDCDVVPADMFEPQKAGVKDGKLYIGENRYNCLILPYSRCLKRNVAEFVIEAAAKGLKVFTIDKAAEYDTGLERLPEEFGRSVQIVPLSELAEEVRKCGQAFITLEKKDPGIRLFTLRQEDGYICMFFNENILETGENTGIIAESFDSVRIYDPWTNKERIFDISDGRLPLQLEPGQALFAVFDKEKRAAEPWPVKKAEQVLSIDWRVSRADENSYGKFSQVLVIPAGGKLISMNGPQMDPGFSGFYRYDGHFSVKPEKDCRYSLYLKAGGDIARIFINGRDAGYLPQFPGSTDITELLADGENSIRIEFTTTLVWKRKDGASTHLQLSATGLTEAPVLRSYT